MEILKQLNTTIEDLQIQLIIDELELEKVKGQEKDVKNNLLESIFNECDLATGKKKFSNINSRNVELKKILNKDDDYQKLIDNINISKKNILLDYCSLEGRKREFEILLKYDKSNGILNSLEKIEKAIIKIAER